MTDSPDVELVETEDDYIHVRFRDPDRYDEIRTPDWAKEPAESVSEGSEVRPGRLEGEDDWEVTSVLIDEHVGEAKARGTGPRDRRENRVVRRRLIVQVVFERSDSSRLERRAGSVPAEVWTIDRRTCRHG